MIFIFIFLLRYIRYVYNIVLTSYVYKIIAHFKNENSLCSVRVKNTRLSLIRRITLKKKFLRLKIAVP